MQPLKPIRNPEAAIPYFKTVRNQLLDHIKYELSSAIKLNRIFNIAYNPETRNIDLRVSQSKYGPGTLYVSANISAIDRLFRSIDLQDCAIRIITDTAGSNMLLSGPKNPEIPNNIESIILNLIYQETLKLRGVLTAFGVKQKYVCINSFYITQKMNISVSNDQIHCSPGSWGPPAKKFNLSNPNCFTELGQWLNIQFTL